MLTTLFCYMMFNKFAPSLKIICQVHVSSLFLFLKLFLLLDSWAPKSDIYWRRLALFIVIKNINLPSSVVHATIHWVQASELIQSAKQKIWIYHQFLPSTLTKVNYTDIWDTVLSKVLIVSHYSWIHCGQLSTRKIQTFHSFFKSFLITRDFVPPQEDCPSPTDQLYHISINDFNVFKALWLLKITRLLTLTVWCLSL